MSVAKEMQRLVAERGDANMEFARGGYRLALNPVEDRFDQVGFILWQEEDGGTVPVAAGRAAGDELVIDGAPASGRETADLEAVIGDLLAGDPVPVAGRGGNDQAVPTGA
jgi:hypothetical protein